MSGWHVQSVDLRGRGHVLRRLDPTGALFLGCALEAGDEQSLRARGALVFPEVPHVPVDQYRASLYTPQELYDRLATSYEDTLDARVYAWSQQEPDLDRSLAKALHDHSIDDALRDVVGGRNLVGIMGGHALARGSAPYAAAAHLAHRLAGAGLTVATGGGPGAMEAANLGAYLSTWPSSVLEEALETLAAVPGFVPSVQDWAGAAFDVLDRWPGGARSVGIPTWHYGHEPPNAFATDIAKYFKNAIREDILLHLATAGIVFLPGAAGTVQEIFQDACENYYADTSAVAPMVLVGHEHWTTTVPVWPVLQALGAGRDMGEHIHLVDTLDDAVAVLDTDPTGAGVPGRDS
ncbi:Rossmann fold nucleotide-binding protein [Georgenia subflava]|uniref:Rossmann fold nucleotide-binding protein n=2 Tax=Georgenia subflava TaxID=1622177 RepID=A0A6N7EHX0_9MICO|nr:Rossmann fold nucleotide-binding protein [Georgenia subflava]